MNSIIKEAGDISWHLFHLYRFLGGDFKNIDDGPNYDYTLKYWSGELVNGSLVLLEEMKKKIYHKHESSNSFLLETLDYLFYCLFGIAKNISNDDGLQKILDTNIEKLKARYPDGFSYERSINREENNAEK
jgi:hypothetical protein